MYCPLCQKSFTRRQLEDFNKRFSNEFKRTEEPIPAIEEEESKEPMLAQPAASDQNNFRESDEHDNENPFANFRFDDIIEEEQLQI